MKILQLNTWMGKVEGNLTRFLETHDFDVICMQEVMSSPDRETHLSRLCVDQSRLQKAARLPYAFFSPNWGSSLAGGKIEWGNLILSKIPFVEQKSVFINGAYNPETILGETPGNNLNVQIVKLENGWTVANHHGFWRPDPLGDDGSVRVFEKLAEVIKLEAAPFVLCGDLNIIHSSPAMRALDFLRDLTDEYQVPTTLSGLKVAFDVPCDHIMISPGLKVENFTVYQELVSDHLAISAELSLDR